MIPEIGLLSLILAGWASLLSPAALWVFRTQPERAWNIVMPACIAAFLCVAIAFGALIASYLDSDFSVMVVVMNSHSAKPWLYKLTGVWGNHEGSMLLWLLILTLFGLLATNLRDMTLRVYTLAIQSALAAGVILFVIFTSNPFERLFPPALKGNDLNPLLQDIGLALHPPLLYLGYVGFSIVFSLACAGLLQGRIDRRWAEQTHPWILFSWTALTIGIGLGSWWAYRELGWGGFWFWDPVENVSLMPWLAGTALLHANRVVMKRESLHAWVIWLAILTFTLSLLGTFLVRSGLLTSVHGFASDPARGLFILGYITLASGGALLLYLTRMPKLESREPIMPLSREGLIVINNLFLLVACATVLIATLYPIVAETLGGQRTAMGPMYFNVTVLPFLALSAFFAGAASLLPWQQGSMRLFTRSASTSAVAALAAMLIVISLDDRAPLLAMSGIGIAVWLAAASITAGYKSFKAGAKIAGYGMAISHFGAAMLVFAITGAGLLKSQHEAVLHESEQFTVGNYSVALAGRQKGEKHNYTYQRAALTVSHNGKPVTSLSPEIRYFPARQSETTEAAIDYGLTRDLYAVMAEAAGGGTVVRFYVNPWMTALWLGFMLVGVGGLAALTRKQNP